MAALLQRETKKQDPNARLPRPAEQDGTYGTFDVSEHTLTVNSKALRAVGLAAVVVLAVFGAVFVFRADRTEISLDTTGSFAAAEMYETAFMDGIDTTKLKQFLYAYASKPHLAGTTQDFKTALYTKQQFESFGLAAEIHTYYPLLSTPISQRVVLTSPTTNARELDLKEKVYEDDACTSSPDETLPFLAYSASANVTAPIVYVNFATKEDLSWLVSQGVALQGKIALAQNGIINREFKIQLVQEYGMAGMIVFSDPATDGYVRGRVYPDGPYRPPGAIEHGTIQNLVLYPGDPLSPGFAVTEGVETLGLDQASNVLPRIPAAVISYDQAALILKSLGGQKAPDSWQGGLRIDGGYRIGDDGVTQLNLDVQMNTTVAPIWNVVATIEGSEDPDQYVLIGNPRDAWVCGAIDPSSGSSVLLEIARNLGELQKQGWRPRRSIKLASWDGESFGQIGSTEFAEDFSQELMDNAVAYINVASTAGPFVRATGSPPIADFLYETAKSVPANNFFGNETDTENLVASLGSNADYTPFYQHLAITSGYLFAAVILDEFTYGAYHSAIDSPVFLAKFGDPHFTTQATMAKWWGLLAMRLASDVVVPFNLSTSATVLRFDLATLENQTATAALEVDLGPLSDAIDVLDEQIMRFEADLDALKLTLAHGPPSRSLDREVDRVNHKLVHFERQCFAERGLPHRPWFRNIVSGVALNKGYLGAGFPGLLDALEYEDSAADFQAHASEIVATILKAAAFLAE